MMRVAALLLVCVLATTCGISGTFAKYVTADAVTETARVAKWGVTVDADLADLFSNDYTTTDTWIGDDGFSVRASTQVVAPGTSGQLVSVSLGGQPEVDVEVTYTANVTLAGWEVIGVTTYCPIIFTINGTDYQIAIGTYPAELETAVEAAVNSYTKRYNAGTDLTTTNGDFLHISWSWPFVGNDHVDTALGDQAADGNAATITIEFNCTVT